MEVKLRSEMSDDFKWDLTHLYKNQEELDSDCAKVEKSIKKLKKFKKLYKLDKLKKCLDLFTDIDKTLNKLFVYAQRYLDQEQNNEDADKLVQRISDLATKFGSESKFITDEVVHFTPDVVDNIFRKDDLKNYHFYIKDTLRQKEHILSKKEEKLLSNISDAFSTSSDVFTIFKNTELQYPTITLKSGEEVLMNETTYKELIESNVREDRKLAFDSLWTTYESYKGTFSKLMYKFIKQKTTICKLRGYDSSLQASLFSDNIPTEIYDKLIENVSGNFDKFHNYLNFRKEKLGCEDMNYYDLYNPLVATSEYKYDYESAKNIILKATKVFGEEYTGIMKTAFSDFWIDLYPNKFKDTGAYMSGSAYDVHPYILMNYNDRYDDVSTLAHELGHAAHSVLSNRNQTYNKSSYSTYIAEIASTTNEILLLDYMLKNSDDKDLKIFLLNNYIEHFRTTVFRQTMFAEFEKFMYETVEKDEVLTPSVMSDKYYELLKKYHGVDDGVMKIDKLYSNEWSRIPHFYYNFYVYQYATSYISSVIIATKILNGDNEQLEKYIELLKSGSSDYPVELLKKAGVDLTDKSCYDTAFNQFSEYLKELKLLLK
jgi:oligoendopeptidase F